jgi:hypothetical protein
MFRIILTALCYTAALAGALVSMAVALDASAETWCASPGPHGEAMYCTDEPENAPKALLGQMHPYTGTLKDYRKLTVVEKYAGIHPWIKPMARERWTRLDSNTWVHDRADGTRSVLRRFPDGTTQYDRPSKDRGWYQEPTGWRWEK